MTSVTSNVRIRFEVLAPKCPSLAENSAVYIPGLRKTPAFFLIVLLVSSNSMPSGRETTLILAFCLFKTSVAKSCASWAIGITT